MNDDDTTPSGDESLGSVIKYVFRDPALADLALSHPSFTHESDGTRGNERLEFLGDAVLDLAIGELLYNVHPDWSEGDLTRSRAGLVNQQSLADYARSIGLDRFVKLGRTEQTTGGEQKNSVLANCFEAVAGAIYLDAGLGAVMEWVGQIFGEAVTGGGDPELRDAKTLFQEWAHSQLQRTPTYRTIRDSGTDNDENRFAVEVIIGNDVWGAGVGRSKRVAERKAAEAAMERIGALESGGGVDG